MGWSVGGAPGVASATLGCELDEPLATAVFAGAWLARGGEAFSSFRLLSDRAARGALLTSIAFASGSLAAATSVSALRGLSAGGVGLAAAGWVTTAGGGAIRVGTTGVAMVAGGGAMEATGGTTGASLRVSAGAATGRWRIPELTVKPRS